MTDLEAPVACIRCGKQGLRTDMFGVEPDLHCESCRDGVAKRMHVRARPRLTDRKPYVTIFCLGLSVLLFVITDVIVRAGPDRPMPTWLMALYQAEPIWIGEVWRHVSVIFLHGGWLHILMNGVAIWSIGRPVEAAWGPVAMAGLMLVTGTAASALEWIMGHSGVGLSGALFGLCGFLWALRRHHPTAAMIMNERMVRWIITLLVIGVVASEFGGLPIGNWAHGGGLAMGFLMGLAMRHRLRRIWLALCVSLMLALVAVSIVLTLGDPVPMIRTGETGATKRFEMPRKDYRTWWIKHKARARD